MEKCILSVPELRERVTGADARLGRDAGDEVPPPDGDSAGARLPPSDAYPGPNEGHMDEDDAYEQVNKMLDQMPGIDGSAAAEPSAAPGEDMNMGLIANIVSEYIKYGCHVGEVFSPPRVNVIARKIGLRPGFSLDLNINDPEDTVPWDFT